MHDGHGHHHHDHDHQSSTSVKTQAMMTYMLEHNRHHAQELHDISHTLAHEGQEAASRILHEAVSDFEAGNLKLEQALGLIKGEG